MDAILWAPYRFYHLSNIYINLLVCVYRLEKVKVKSIRSQAKLIGTAATVGGAMMMTLMKGPLLELFWTKPASHQQQSSVNLSHSIKGALMITIGCFSWACFMVLQVINYTCLEPDYM